MVSLQPDVSHVSRREFCHGLRPCDTGGRECPSWVSTWCQAGLVKWNSIWDNMQYYWDIYLLVLIVHSGLFILGIHWTCWFVFFRPFVSWLQRSILNQFCFVRVATPLRPLTGHRSDGSSTIGDCKWWALGCFCWDGAMAPHLTTKNWWFRKIYPPGKLAELWKITVFNG